MSVSSFRRRVRYAVGERDWLEGWATALGVFFLLLAVGCASGVVVSLTTFGDPEPGFDAAPGFLQAARGTGVILFGVLGLVSTGVGWFLAGEAIRRAAGRLRDRS